MGAEEDKSEIDEISQDTEVSDSKSQLLRPGKIEERLVYEPTVRRVGDQLEITVKNRDPSRIAWGFWGLLVMLSGFGLYIFWLEDFYALRDLLWVGTVLAVGAILLSLGRRTNLSRSTLMEARPHERKLRWCGEDSWFDYDEFEEVVFAMIRYPVESQPSPGVEAFTLLLRDDEGDLRTVIEATPNIRAGHEMARFIGSELDLDITYVGEGVRD